MLITKIEQQKKNKSRWSIFADGSFVLGVSEDTIFKFGLRVKDELDDNELRKIREYDEYIYGKKIAFDFLSYRTRSVKEIKDKLKKKSISADSIDKVIEHLAKLNLINDEVFAQEFVNAKVKFKPSGKRVLSQKLIEKGIAKEVREKVLSDTFERVDEKELAMQNFKKYFNRLKDKEPLEQRKKMFDHLVRKGFGFDLVKEIIKENIK